MKRFAFILNEWNIVSTLFLQAVSYAFVIYNAIVIRLSLRLNVKQMFACNKDRAYIV